jgi:dipeptidyl aminopeptidase/acylaminoacyl peptidase
MLLSLAAVIAIRADAQNGAKGFDPAIAFGAQASVQNVELSPDGKHVAYIGPGTGTVTGLFIVDIAAGKVQPIARADGQPARLANCEWSSSDRLVCKEQGLYRSTQGGMRMTVFTRLYAIDVDGKNLVALGQRTTADQLYGRQLDGEVIDWLSGSDGKVLMGRYYVPEMSTGKRTADTSEGYGVDLIDTHTGKSSTVENPKNDVSYISDGRGNVRLMERDWTGRDGLYNGKSTFYYRSTGSKDWKELGTDDQDHAGIEPVAVDSGINAVYVRKRLDGRWALYRISLDGSLKSELVFAQPEVDVDGVVTVGRSGRVIGASYATDKPYIEYFDPSYKQLAASLARALPNLPLIYFISASADEQILLIYAGSDSDPGHYYLFNRANKHLDELMLERPELEKVKLAHVQAVTYPAADGTKIPGYLTLPPGVDKPASLPTIVMPHGGPAYRDVWGFDWLAQYYAARGFAVLQPNFRGSTGYGNDWFVSNGFRSWKTAIGDVVDAGHWLVSQGIADPAKLAIVGWSYGGYAALQANVVDPDLFKAVIAVAPVTDLQMLKDESMDFRNALVDNAYIGSGPDIIEQGSPARHAQMFKAPVLLFHGELDANVELTESKAMDEALKRAGKQSQLVVYPKLDHQLYDSAARADMLQRSYQFLLTAVKP